MQTIITLDELKTWRVAQGSSSVAFVPTMGALHAGHLALVRKAQQLADKVIVSIFVNPIQFGPKEDFATYPRTLAEDMEQLGRLGADAVFLPNASQMYPDHFQTYVTNETMAQVLCGASRPGHFRGVLTVVAKLFNLIQPKVAVFGKKDYQQWRMIEQMVQDLAMPLTIVGEDTLREEDGLAMSSRNRRLTPEHRQSIAPQLYKGLQLAQQAYVQGERSKEELVARTTTHLQQYPDLKLEYVALHDQAGLAPVADLVKEPAVMLVAARLGDVRLIDNIELGT